MGISMQSVAQGLRLGQFDCLADVDIAIEAACSSGLHTFLDQNPEGERPAALHMLVACRGMHVARCLRDQLSSRCAQMHGFSFSHLRAGVRRTKMVALAEQYLKAVQSASQGLLEALTPGAVLRPLSAASGPTRPAAVSAAARRAAAAAEAEDAAEAGTIQQSGLLPKSILANREPYRHGEWRRQPFVPRWAVPHWLDSGPLVSFVPCCQLTAQLK